MAKSAKKNQIMKQPETVQVAKKNKGKTSKAPTINTPKPKKPKKTKKARTKKPADPYRLSKPYRQIAWQLNKAYDEVRNAGYYSNNIKLFEKTLEGFYEKYNLKVKNPHHISMQKQMPEEAVEELAKIALRFADIAVEDRSFFLDDITKGLTERDKKMVQQKQQEAIINDEDEIEIGDVKMPWDKFDVDKFEKIQDLYGVETIQDFIDWTDEMERFRMDSFLTSVLTSDQVADVFSYAIEAQKDNPKAKLDFNAISKMAYREYKNNGGIVGDGLRKAIYARISRAKR